MAAKKPLPYLLKPSEALLGKLFSGPVRAAIGGVLAFGIGLVLYNWSSRPTTQTTTGITNEVLIVAAAAFVLVIYLRPKSKR